MREPLPNLMTITWLWLTYVNSKRPRYLVLRMQASYKSSTPQRAPTASLLPSHFQAMAVTLYKFSTVFTPTSSQASVLRL